jgi:uncharacterized protein
MDEERFRRGVELFNGAKFFEAHEILEEVWRAAPQAEKKPLQGLIQIAVAMHHCNRGNRAGARSLLKRAAGNLTGCPKNFAGLQLAGLVETISDWERALACGQTAPPLPKLVCRE